MLTSPPHVPPAVNRKHPAKVVVELEVTEVDKEIEPTIERALEKLRP